MADENDPKVLGQSKVTMTKEMIDEITATLKALEGKEIPHGQLVNINPGKQTAWYIAYST